MIYSLLKRSVDRQSPLRGGGGGRPSWLVPYPFPQVLSITLRVPLFKLPFSVNGKVPFHVFKSALLKLQKEAYPFVKKHFSQNQNLHIQNVQSGSMFGQFWGVSQSHTPPSFPCRLCPHPRIQNPSVQRALTYAANMQPTACKAKTLSLPNENNIKTANDVCITQGVNALSRRTKTSLIMSYDTPSSLKVSEKDVLFILYYYKSTSYTYRMISSKFPRFSFSVS